MESQQKLLEVLEKSFYSDRVGEIFEKLKSYDHLLNEYNKKINLISHNDLNRLWERHFIDSIQPILLFQDHFYSSETITKKIIDVGSGAGLPGVPMAVLLNQAQFYFVESIEKKCDFIQKVIKDLGLKQCSVLCNRAEILGQDTNYREQFDIAVSRAIAKPPTAFELVLPFIKLQGFAYFFASGLDWGDSKKNSQICKLIGCQIYKQEPYMIVMNQNIEDKRIICVQKKERTDPGFPRKVGTPSKRPLK
jgi:16S rRNA (guanine527-N7)-methyltransferase